MDSSNQDENSNLVVEVSKKEYEANTAISEADTALSGVYKSNPSIAEPPPRFRTLTEETVDKGITFLEKHKFLLWFLGLGVFLSITGLDLTQLIIYFGNHILE